MKNVINKIVGTLIGVLIIVVIILGLAYLTKTLIFKVFANEEVHTEEYTVSANQTLWDIAEENKKPGTDTREYVYNLRKLNNIDCIILPGQTIQIIK